MQGLDNIDINNFKNHLFNPHFKKSDEFIVEVLFTFIIDILLFNSLFIIKTKIFQHNNYFFALYFMHIEIFQSTSFYFISFLLSK